MDMSEAVKKIGWIGAGVAVGAALTVTVSSFALREPTLPVPVEDLKAFSEVYSRIKSEYVEPVSDKKLIKEAIQGMVSGLDPHSTYLDEEGIKEMRTTTEGKFGGVGIEIGAEDGFIRVVAPIDDTPAKRAGIMAGDLIVKVDNESTKGMPQDKAVGKMRGKPGTKVALEVFRKSDTSSLTFNLTREEIKIWSVRSKMLEPGYGYIRLRSFQEPTMADFAKEARELYKQGDLKGLVLDLRDDPGGLLNASVGISAALLPKDALVVYTDGRNSDSKMRFTSRREDYCHPPRCMEDPMRGLPPGLKTVPVTILVNAGSASASEIVAGALKDHKRATLIGTTTFGKGSVQTVLQLSNNAALKLTTQRYYTPSGISIQAKGIEPDIVIDQLTFDGVSESDFKRTRESEYEHSLTNPSDAGKAAPKKPEALPESNEVVKVNKRPERLTPETYDQGVPAKDYQLTQALNHLKGLPVVKSSKPQQTASVLPAAK
jgi:carboxyl-terminal processing protease